MKYEVYKIEESGNEEILGDHLSERRAEAMARRAAATAKTGKVFVRWFRAADGQLGYLNRDGHNPVGHAW